jgi:hypothetical protein
MKTRAAVPVAMIPDVAMPAVRRLVEREAPGRERSEGPVSANDGGHCS